MRVSLVLLSASLLLARCNQPLFGPQPAEVKPALWVVRDADTTLYLFGTIQPVKAGHRWFAGPLRKAFDASSELVLEKVEARRGEDLSALIETQSGKPPTPLSADTRARLAECLRQLRVPPEAPRKTSIWRLAMKLSAWSARHAGYPAGYGIERMLIAVADAHHISRVSLDAPLVYYGDYANLSPPAQEAMLRQALAMMPKTKANVEANTQAWEKGDAEGLARLVNADLAVSPELTKILLTDRDRRWTDWVAARMKRPGTVFVAIGAGHLAGPAGMLAEIGKRGLKVERVQ